MKQTIKLTLSFIFSRPVGLITAILLCSVAIAQLIVISEICINLGKHDIYPESLKTIMVYVRSSRTQGDIDKLSLELTSMRGVSKTVHIPSKEGLNRLKAWLGKDSTVVSDINEYILPDAFAVILKDENIADAARVADAIKKMPMVSDVRYNSELTAGFASLVDRASVLLRPLAAVYVFSLGIMIFSIVRIRLVKNALKPIRIQSMWIYNLSLLTEALFYIMISAAAGLFLADAFIGHAQQIIPEIRNLIPVRSLNGVLAAEAFALIFVLAAAVFSMKVRD
jgi:cell division protein FtsX